MSKKPDNQWQYGDFGEASFSAKTNFETPKTAGPFGPNAATPSTGPTLDRAIHDYGTTMQDVENATDGLLKIKPQWPDDTLVDQPEITSNDFVLFRGHSDLEYVLLTVSRNGLNLFWAKISDVSIERLEQQKQLLLNRGFAEIEDQGGTKTLKQIDALEENQLLVAFDGLYAQFGQDRDQIVELVLSLLRQVFDVHDVSNIRIDHTL